MHKEQTGGPTRMPDDPFVQLNDNYASLGSDLSYYEKLYTLGRQIYRPFLRGLHDVAFDDEKKAEFEDTEGYRVSLLRFSGAERTIEDAAKLLSSETPLRRRKSAGFRSGLRPSLLQPPTHSPSLLTFVVAARYLTVSTPSSGTTELERPSCSPTWRLSRANMATTRRTTYSKNQPVVSSEDSTHDLRPSL